MREGMPGVPIDVPLDGAREFVLKMAMVATASAAIRRIGPTRKVVLADGQEIALG